MKSTKNSLLLLVALLISTVNIALASGPEGNGRLASVSQVICYQVKINLPSEQDLCNLYQVEILDGEGYQVVPAKILISGIGRYEFFEKGPVRGVRIARLVIAPIDNGGSPGLEQAPCNFEYYTMPVVRRGPFANGQTYVFELFPQIRPIN